MDLVFPVCPYSHSSFMSLFAHKTLHEHTKQARYTQVSSGGATSLYYILQFLSHGWCAKLCFLNLLGWEYYRTSQNVSILCAVRCMVHIYIKCFFFWNFLWLSVSLPPSLPLLLSLSLSVQSEEAVSLHREPTLLWDVYSGGDRYEQHRFGCRGPRPTRCPFQPSETLTHSTLKTSHSRSAQQKLRSGNRTGV